MWAEYVSVRQIAEEVGTPCYIYSSATIAHHIKAFREAFAELEPLVCYSVKANPNLAILKLLTELGAGFDVVSGGELFRALRVGADPQKIAFTGVGKTRAEMQHALRSGILLFNVESEAELELLSEVALSEGRNAQVGLRISPDVNPHTHSYMTTGKHETKFGLLPEQARSILESSEKYAGVEVVGVHSHIGSQITNAESYVGAADALLEFVEEFGERLRYFDLGGGFGVDYREGEAVPMERYAEELVPILRGLECQIIFEPGRFIVASAGILVTKLLYRKFSGGKMFYVCDAGMNDLIRPALYGAYHRIWTVEGGPVERDGTVVVDVVGPVCESGDFFAKERLLPDVPEGSLLAVFTAGAYGASMGSNYNSRPLPPEVLVEGRSFRIIRRRQSYEELVSLESV